MKKMIRQISPINAHGAIPKVSITPGMNVSVIIAGIATAVRSEASGTLVVDGIFEALPNNGKAHLCSDKMTVPNRDIISQIGTAIAEHGTVEFCLKVSARPLIEGEFTGSAYGYNYGWNIAPRPYKGIDHLIHPETIKAEDSKPETKPKHAKTPLETVTEG